MPEKTLFSMAWIIKELEVLTKKMRDLVVDITCLNDKIQDENYDLVKENVPRKLMSISTSLKDAVKLLSKHQRTAATHLFVILISTESRCSKPYALPVQCLPIAGLRDRQARDLANSVITYMTERGMKVAGMWKKKKIPLTSICLNYLQDLQQMENLTAFAGKAIHVL